MAKILLADDDTDFCLMVEQILRLQKHSVDMVHDGALALDYLKNSFYDLVLLDWNIPSLDGLSVCRAYREAGGKAKIIMLTGKADISSKVEGLEWGADDYMTKPFDGRELNARIKALLRRTDAVEARVLSLAGVSMDLNQRIVRVNGSEVKLKPKEYILLEFFLKHPGEVFSIDTLLDRLWKTDSDASDDAVRMVITRLRRKLKEAGGAGIAINTEFGVGYKLTLDTASSL
jgi:DNA-binding response OmpR family regulator